MLKQNKLQFYRYEFKAMGTPCEIQLYAKTHKLAEQITQRIVADVRRLEAIYSRYRGDSFLTKINQVAAVGGSITVDPETASLLNYAATCYAESDGLFDITSGILRQAWSFQLNVLPDETHIQALLEKVGWDKVNWSYPLLSFLIPGMELDFGGVVKEYAVDRAATLCQAAGIQHGLINLGGDIKVIGSQPDGSAWNIGIRHPRQTEEILQTLSLTEGALASSGDYERCIVLDGVRYGHILNPKTGWPVRHLAAVSVVADFCVIAGSAATIAMLKEDKGAAWLENLGLPHIWVDVSGNTGGLLIAEQ
jgi:thiamine biosynthesis lipoprotein